MPGWWPLLAAGMLLAPLQAHAQASTQLGDQADAQQAALQAGGWRLTGQLETELNLDLNGRRGGRGRYADLFNKTELGVYLSLPGGFTVNSVFKLEPADRPADGSDRAFHAQAAWVDQLYLAWSQGPLQLFAGKIHPRFGMAWDEAPGLYGTDFAEGYELSEKIGGGVNLSLSDLASATDRLGQHSLQLEFFQADRSALSSSLFARRWSYQDGQGRLRYSARNRRAYGGPDNTEGAGNWVASLAGQEVPLPLGELSYTLGYSSRRAGLDSLQAGTAATERGVVAGLAWEVPLGGDITATPLVEWVRQENADGLRGLRRQVVTAGAELARGPVSLAYVYEWLKERGDDAARAAMHTASASYALPWVEGLVWTVGWRRLREEGQAANDYGTQLSYSLRF
ncbi:hypothetical protein [Roseomonas sp. 18066]|uniref:hypothetical protein n=1 Tax=Roseomonas sp. 18066 TaxID=2681412 RepID=UPI00135BBAF2|nr:hypothetical protein [Roseomonas sp. 18066]